MLPGSSEKSEFLSTFKSISRHEHRYSVFSDFVTMSAIALHNAVNKIDTLEAEYMSIVGRYSKEDAHKFAKLLGCLINLLDAEPTDVLGQLYMELELGNDGTGQFFTPPTISELMSQMSVSDDLKELGKPFVTVSEPACGAGGMVLAFAKQMISNGHDPAQKMWAQCTDVDRVAALMCYLQLSVWNIPAQVIVGNTLTMEYREQYYTPAHYLYKWDEKFRVQKMIDLVKAPVVQPKPKPILKDPDPGVSKPPEEKRKIAPGGEQLDLF